MNLLTLVRLARFLLLGMVLAATSFAPPAYAQERPAPVAELAGGVMVFSDNGSPAEGFVGGTARFYVSPRISVGPELSFIHGDEHSHFMLTGNVTIDLRPSLANQPRRVVPFVVVGAGLFQTREQLSTGPFTHTEGSFTAGGGVRVWLNDRVMAGAEVRVGWELHVRVNGMIGIRLGK